MNLQFGKLNITPSVVERLKALDYSVEELQCAIEDHKSSLDGQPSVYVGTYAKYNSFEGNSLQGLWVDLTSFVDYDDFMRFCYGIHSDESDPELMAQDAEGFPRQWYQEGFITEEDFNNIVDYWFLCEKYSQDAVDDFMEFNDDLLEFEEAYCGEWASEEDFAEHIVDECYDLNRSMGSLSQYFDYAAFARDLFDWDYNMGANNHVFRRV